MGDFRGHNLPGFIKHTQGLLIQELGLYVCVLPQPVSVNMGHDGTGSLRPDTNADCPIIYQHNTHIFSSHWWSDVTARSSVPPAVWGIYQLNGPGQH